MGIKPLSSPHVQLVELSCGGIEDQGRHLHTNNLSSGYCMNIENATMLPILRMIHWHFVRDIGEYCHLHAKVTRNQDPLPT